jgi:hypothetical protein
MKSFFVVLAALLGIAGELQAQRKCGKVKPISHRAGIYTSGELAGRTLGDLYAAYVGARNIPEKVTVDAGRQLDSLWKVKLSCYKTASVVRKLHGEFLASYRGSRSAKTLAEFVDIADHHIRSSRADMNWKRFRALYKLSDEQVNVVQALSDRLTGRDFVAYGMTELMPTADGVLNLQVLDFLVRNFGPEFVYRIPAIHDRYASFGFFQFTSYAVNGRTREGASLASLALDRSPIPGSVADVRDELQFRAAYLFAMHNIALMVKRLGRKNLAVLAGLGARNHDDLIQFIAAAHNGPAHARSAAERWLGNNMRSDFLVSVGNPSVRRYAYKTKMNLLALRNHDLSGILYGSR